MQTLSHYRLDYQPNLPHILNHIQSLSLKETPLPTNEAMKTHLPRTLASPLVEFQESSHILHKPQRVGVVFSGGQAAGGHNVIVGLYEALKKLHPDSTLYGFLNGPAGIIKNQCVELTGESIAPFRNQGGFDMIGSGRTKIETTEQFFSAVKTVSDMRLDGLVIIGGDDSNTNSALLAEHFLEQGVSTKVIGVPKTIDGDLKNLYIETTFGFDSATKTYSTIIANIMRDALSAKKYWFFIKLMGRSASNITLECAHQTHPNVAIIGEEIAAKGQSLSSVVDQLVDIIERRAQNGKNYGVALIPEGVIEFIPEFRTLIAELNTLLASDTTDSVITKLTPDSARCYAAFPESIQQQLIRDRDPHGNVEVSQIETERLFIELVRNRYKGTFNAQPYFCGYEGRCCLPSNFDAQYCYSLGYVAALLVDAGRTGYMSCIRNLTAPVDAWEPIGVPLAGMMAMEMRKGAMKPVIHKALVDLQSTVFTNFAAVRDHWALNDDYLYPGPIQFYGPPALTDSITYTLLYSHQMCSHIKFHPLLGIHYFVKLD